MTAHSPMAFATAKSPYLVISRVGRDSLHRQWLPKDGGFDVLLSCYDPDVEPDCGNGVLFEIRPGAKVAGYGQTIRAHQAIIREYRYVALFDDDLATDSASLLQLFSIAEERKLKIAQPALDHTSYFTYACLLQHKGFVLRHINFVEMMCPIFRSDLLLALAPLFELGFESGIDLVWSALAHDAPEDFAVIDSVPVHHARPVGAAKSVNGFTNGRIYETDVQGVLKRFGLPWLPVLPYGGLRANGSYTSSRLSLALEAMRLAAAVPIRSVRFRISAIGRYWRQLLRGRAHNIEARWPDGWPRPGSL